MATTTTDDYDGLTLRIANATQSVITGFRVAFLISAIVSIILGVALLVWPVKTLSVVAIVLGIWFVVLGLIRIGIGIFASTSTPGHRVLNIVLGLLLLFIGAICLRNTTSTAAVLVLLAVAVVGVGFITSGILEIVEARGTPGSGWAVASGILTALVGVLVLVVPVWTGAVLTLFTGISLLVLGIFGIIRAVTLGRDLKRA